MLPALYIVAASLILVVLLAYRTDTTWPGLTIVLLGVPVYALWRKWGTPVPLQVREMGPGGLQ